METSDRSIYFKLAEYAQKVFAGLDEIDKRTYTAAELAKYMKRDQYGKHTCKEPAAVLLRRALEVYFNADTATATITEGSFECQVRFDSVWEPLANFEKLACIPKAEQVKFTAKSKADVLYRIAATLPKDAGLAKKYVCADKFRPQFRNPCIDIANGWLWATNTNMMYGGRCEVRLEYGEADVLPIPAKFTSKFAGQSVALTYYEDGSIECNGECESLESSSQFKILAKFKNVVPKVNPDTKIKLSKAGLANLKKFLKICKDSDQVITLSCESAGPMKAEREDGSNVMADLDQTSRCDIRMAYKPNYLQQVLGDSNGEVWCNGANSATIFETKAESSFLLLMPTPINHTDNFKKETDYLTLKTTLKTEKIMASKIVETPLMQQYKEMKRKHPDAILLFRVGDFYEVFSEDAVAVSEILGITLTRRANGAGGYVELSGFPHHALDKYLPKLIRAGKRVAICEELNGKQEVKEEVKQPEPETKAEAETSAETTPAPEAEAEPSQETEPEPDPMQQLKEELCNCALSQLPTGAEVVAAKFLPIGDNNGKWQMILKMGGVYRYADIVAMARYLYICDRTFFATDEVATLMGIPLTKPEPSAPAEPAKVAPAPVETGPVDEILDMKKMFMDDYGKSDDEAMELAESNFTLRHKLASEKSVEFTFRKKDGSERVAHGTLHPDVIPAVGGEADGGDRKSNPKFQTYWDLDKLSWRCFEKANLVAF